jgi:hypothetical protein
LHPPVEEAMSSEVCPHLIRVDGEKGSSTPSFRMALCMLVAR